MQHCKLSHNVRYCCCVIYIYVVLGVPEPVQRIEIWLDDAHWWLTQKDGQLEIADISINNFRYAPLYYLYSSSYTWNIFAVETAPTGEILVVKQHARVVAREREGVHI